MILRFLSGLIWALFFACPAMALPVMTLPGAPVFSSMEQASALLNAESQPTPRAGNERERTHNRARGQKSDREHDQESSRGPAAPVARAKVLGTMPHNPEHFTQGLFFSGPYLYESTGRYGQSGLFRLDPQTGAVLQARSFARHFVEGSAVLDGNIHLLTWQDGSRLILRESDMSPLKAVPLSGEGWGLCSDGQALWMSDGSSVLRRMRASPAGEWDEQARLRIIDAGRPVERLNELEWVNGLIFANIWQSDRIAVIDPAVRTKSGGPAASSVSCPVLLWIDCAALAPRALKGNPDAVLNGIAWDAKARRLIVTGKLWPVFYELALPEELNGVVR